MPKKKPFIDKKNSVTFQLVHRSQKDPLIADETAPSMVLKQVTDPQAAKKTTIEEKEKRKEEERKYGIYYDDNYDYLQHLRDVTKLSSEWQRIENSNSSKTKQDKNDKNINLPSSVFASNVEEKVGMLNKAAPVTGPQLDLDHDVMAALDDDFDFNDPENQLEDNFMELANAESDDSDDSNKECNYELDEYDDESISSDGYMDDEEADKIGSLDKFQKQETNSRYTKASSCSTRRSVHLELLDRKFQHMLETQYNESEIGALECYEIQGHVSQDSEIMLECLKEFEKMQTEDMDNLKELDKDRMEIMVWEDSKDDYEKMVIVEKDKWDCQSIRSKLSNTLNRPKLIPNSPKCKKKIEIDGKTGIPKNVLGKTGKLTATALAQLDSENVKLNGTQSIAESRRSTLSTLSIRPKGETLEEKKERKQLLKDYRRERRMERKANTNAFKEEKKRQEKIRLNNRQNIQGCHIP